MPNVCIEHTPAAAKHAHAHTQLLFNHKQQKQQAIRGLQIAKDEANMKKEARKWRTNKMLANMNEL